MQVIIKNPCKAGGKHHMPSDEPVDLSDKEAKLLIESGSVEVFDGKPAGPTKPTDEAELKAAIVAAVESLDKENAALWTNGGKPQVAAISEALGYSITAAERDAALATE